MKVLVPYPDELVNLFKTIIGDQAEIVQSERSVESMLEHGGDVEIIASVTVPGGYIRKASNLRMIQTFGAGIDSVDLDAVRERGDIIVDLGLAESLNRQTVSHTERQNIRGELRFA